MKVETLFIELPYECVWYTSCLFVLAMVSVQRQEFTPAAQAAAATGQPIMAQPTIPAQTSQYTMQYIQQPGVMGHAGPMPQAYQVVFYFSMTFVSSMLFKCFNCSAILYTATRLKVVAAACESKSIFEQPPIYYLIQTQIHLSCTYLDVPFTIPFNLIRQVQCNCALIIVIILKDVNYYTHVLYVK